MAASLPAKLKIKDITPFAVRAAQLEKHKPIVSYWCNYYIVDQILTKGLHSADNECMQYTTALMDKLEQTKTEQAGNDAILDDVAAKAYIEQFALDTFQRADDAIHSNKASRQTIDTFQAAVTFFDLLNMSIWAPVDPDITAKSKYAKFHAVRIAKAIKAGEDPNASNPVDEPDAPQENTYQPPTVESVPESQQPSRPTSIAQHSPIASPPIVAPSTASPSTQLQDQVSPVESAANPRQNSVGGGYFPAVPTFPSDSAAPEMPPANPTQPFVPSVPSPSPSQYYTQPTQQNNSLPAHAPAPLAPPAAAPVPLPPVQAVPQGAYRTDDDSVALAQKHAKWAMSALNFDDVNTAVKELRLALQTLGAS